MWATEIDNLTTTGFELILGQSSGMIKQTEHLKNLIWILLHFGLHRHIGGLLHYTSGLHYGLDTYNKHGFWLLTGLCTCWFPICFVYVLLIIHASSAGCLQSWFIYHHGGLQFSLLLLHWLRNMYAHYLSILGDFGCIL